MWIIGGVCAANGLATTSIASIHIGPAVTNCVVSGVAAGNALMSSRLGAGNSYYGLLVD